MRLLLIHHWDWRFYSDNGDVKSQAFTSQRMIAIQNNNVIANLDNPDRTLHFRRLQQGTNFAHLCGHLVYGYGIGVTSG